MTGSSRTRPQTVPDSDREAYEEMCRRQRAYNETQEARLCGRHPSKKVADTAKTAGRVGSGVELATAGLAAASNDPDDLATAVKVGKVLKPVGAGVAVVGTAAGFHADRARGMPLDEAIIKHGGGVALGTGLGALGASAGAAAGAVGGPPGAFAGGVTGRIGGQETGEAIAEAAAGGWAGVKQFARQFGRTAQQGLARVNDPRYWVGRKRLNPWP